MAKAQLLGCSWARATLISVRRALKPCEWEAKFESLEDNCVHKEERFLRACAVINAHELTLLARQNLHVYVELPPEYVELIISLTLLVRSSILKGGDFGGLG